MEQQKDEKIIFCKGGGCRKAWSRDFEQGVRASA